MPFIILSWNIEHLRTDKLTRTEEDYNNFRAFYDIICQADIIFLYECKHQGTVTEVQDLLNQPTKKLERLTGHQKGELTTYKWAGDWYAVGGNEGVVIFWKTTAVKEVGKLDGVASQYLGLNLGERIPACVSIKTLNGAHINLGAWHCAGPAVTMAKDVTPQILNIQGLDLLFGDMNFQGAVNPSVVNPDETHLLLRASSVFGVPEKVSGAPALALGGPTLSADSQKVSDKDFWSDPEKYTGSYGSGHRPSHMTELHSVGDPISSTYTETGPTARTSPIDRVFASNQYKGSTQVIQMTGLNHERAKKLTNHVPVFIIVRMDT